MEPLLQLSVISFIILKLRARLNQRRQPPSAVELEGLRYELEGIKVSLGRSIPERFVRREIASYLGRLDAEIWAAKTRDYQAASNGAFSFHYRTIVPTPRKQGPLGSGGPIGDSQGPTKPPE